MMESNNFVGPAIVSDRHSGGEMVKGWSGTSPDDYAKSSLISQREESLINPDENANLFTLNRNTQKAYQTDRPSPSTQEFINIEDQMRNNDALDQLMFASNN